MKIQSSLLLTLSLVLNSLSISGQSYGNQEVKNVSQFMIKLQDACLSKDSNLLNTLIYPFEGEMSNMPKQLISSILANDVNSRGDGAYSDKALSIIISQALEEFVPISTDIREQLARDPAMRSIFKDVKNIELPILDYKGAHIILIKYRKQYKLLFWEDLNKVLE